MTDRNCQKLIEIQIQRDIMQQKGLTRIFCGVCRRNVSVQHKCVKPCFQNNGGMK